MAIHHATTKKAEKAGIVLKQDDNSDRVGAIWADKNKRGYAANSAGAPGLLDDMLTYRMLTLEYPQLKVAQPGLKQDQYGWTISLRGDVIGEAARLKDAWDAAFEVLTDGDDEGEEDEQEADGEPVDDEAEEEDEGKSIIGAKYKTKYRPFKQTNGDDIAQQLARHLKVPNPDDPKGKPVIDVGRLQRFAKANGCWSDDYLKLNVGMRRLNIGNRLRAILRKNPGYQIDWKK